MSVATATRPSVPGRSAAPAGGPTVRQTAARAWDVTVVIVANAIVVLALWVRHGGLGTLSHPGGTLTAIGQLTGCTARSPCSSSCC